MGSKVNFGQDGAFPLPCVYYFLFHEGYVVMSIL